MVQSQNGVLVKVWNYILFELCTKVTMLMLLVQLVLGGKEIDVGGLFIVYGLYNNLKLTCLRLMPIGILQLSEGLVAIRRMQVLLICL